MDRGRRNRKGRGRLLHDKRPGSRTYRSVETSVCLRRHCGFRRESLVPRRLSRGAETGVWSRDCGAADAADFHDVVFAPDGAASLFECGVRAGEGRSPPPPPEILGRAASEQAANAPAADRHVPGVRWWMFFVRTNDSGDCGYECTRLSFPAVPTGFCRAELCGVEECGPQRASGEDGLNGGCKGYSEAAAVPLSSSRSSPRAKAPARSMI